jgi:hypothetical protein
MAIILSICEIQNANSVYCIIAIDKTQEQCV